MSVYTKRKYNFESRLPLDLRTPLSKFPSSMFWNFSNVEEWNTDYNSQLGIRLNESILKFTKIQYISSFLFKRWKYLNMKYIYTGSLIGILLVSKTYFMNLEKRFFRQDYDDFGFKIRYRFFFGHCIWKRVRRRVASLLIRSHILDIKFFFRFQLYAPNILCVFPLLKKKGKRIGKLKKFKLKILGIKRRREYFKQFHFPKKVLPSYLSKLRNVIYPRLALSHKKPSRQGGRKKRRGGKKKRRLLRLRKVDLKRNKS